MQVNKWNIILPAVVLIISCLLFIDLDKYWAAAGTGLSALALLSLFVTDGS